MLTVIFPNQSEPVFSFSRVKVWVRWSDPQMCWWNAFNLIRGSNCRSGLISISWSAVWSPLVKRARRQLDIVSHWRLCCQLQTFLLTDISVHDWQVDTGTEQLPEEERKKFEKEFDEYREKLDRAKEECVTQISESFLAVHSSSVS